MECCFAVRKKNKAPAMEYQPYNSSKIQVMVEKEENDIVAINTEIEKKSKLNKLTKLNMDPPQEFIPFPPRTVNINISI